SQNTQEAAPGINVSTESQASDAPAAAEAAGNSTPGPPAPPPPAPLTPVGFTAPLSQLLDRALMLQSRFLYSFVFDRQAVGLLVDVIVGQKQATRKGEQPLWERAEPTRAYVDELLLAAAGYLFPDQNDPGARAKGCGYLQITDTAANRWFHGAAVELKPA